MDFGECIKLMADGKKVRCPEWIGWWYKKNGQICVHMEDGTENYTPWTSAMFRHDWELVEE